eukprot:4886887-Alexandrium_andersonii.AAC.1
MVAIQEHGVPQARVKPFQISCRQKGAVAHLGPTDPEARSAAGGVGFVHASSEAAKAYPPATASFRKAHEAGRAMRL